MQSMEGLPPLVEIMMSLNPDSLGDFEVANAENSLLVRSKCI